jgi:hypothetical protein
VKIHPPANIDPENPQYFWITTPFQNLDAYVMAIMFTPARDFLLETPWRIIIPNPNVNSHSL